MYECPHCGKATFVGSGTCNHCERAFVISRLEDLFMRYDGIEQLGMRVVPRDDDAASVVFLLREAGKKGKPASDVVAIHDYKREGEGWKYWTATTLAADLARKVAEAVVEVAS